MNATVIAMDTRSWNKAVVEFASVVNKGGVQIIRDEVRLLINHAMRITPPRNKKQGEMAVVRDFNRAVHLAVTSGEGMAFKNERVRKLIENNDEEGFRAFLKNTPSLSNFTVIRGSQIPSYHKKARNKRGRVVRRQPVVTMDAASHRSRREKVVSHVGRMRAGWVPAYTAAQQGSGGNMRQPASWVNRHSAGARGRAANMLGVPMRPSFMLENYTNGIGQITTRFQTALNQRARSMVRKAELLVTGKLKYRNF